MRLSRSVIRVLSQDDHLDITDVSGGPGEHVLGAREHRVLLPLRRHEVAQLAGGTAHTAVTSKVMSRRAKLYQHRLSCHSTPWLLNRNINQSQSLKIILGSYGAPTACHKVYSYLSQSLIYSAMR